MRGTRLCCRRARGSFADGAAFRAAATAEKRAEYQKRIADQLGMSLLDTPYSDHGALRGAAPDAPPALHRLPPEALSVEALKGAENPTYLTEEGAIALLLDGTSRDPKQVMVLLGHIRRYV